MTAITQLATIERNLPKSQADWDRLFVEFLQWQRTIQGMQWQPITLQNGWTAYGATYAPPQYYVDASGRLFCRGLLSAGTVTDGTVIFTLPFTPSYRVLTFGQGYTTTTTYQPVRIDVLQNGNVEVYNAASLAWLSLDQFNFSLIQ
jgi:hypothetical protein